MEPQEGEYCNNPGCQSDCPEGETQASSQYSEGLEGDDIDYQTIQSDLVAPQPVQDFDMHSDQSSADKAQMIYFLREKVVYLKIFCFLVIAFNIFLVYHYFLEGLVDPFYQWLFWWLHTDMSLINCYSWILTSNTRVSTYQRKKQKGFEGEDYNICQKCPNGDWKPMRAHHCSICGKCVVKMDHHCPAVLSCVGYRNHSSFLVFTYVFTIHCFFSYVCQFWYFYQFSRTITQNRTPLYLGFWGIVLFFNDIMMLLLMLMGIGISYNHTIFISKSQTTLEEMSKGCHHDTNHRATGSFDLGLIYNIRNSFVTPFMLFFIPMLKEAKYEGYWFARIGVPREHIESVTYVLNNFKVNGIDLKVAEPSQMIGVSKSIYSNHTFLFGKMIVRYEDEEQRGVLVAGEGAQTLQGGLVTQNGDGGEDMTEIERQKQNIKYNINQDIGDVIQTPKEANNDFYSGESSSLLQADDDDDLRPQNSQKSRVSGYSGSSKPKRTDTDRKIEKLEEPEEGEIPVVQEFEEPQENEDSSSI